MEYRVWTNRVAKGLVRFDLLSVSKLRVITLNKSVSLILKLIRNK